MLSYAHARDPEPLRQEFLPDLRETATILSSFLAVWQILRLIFTLSHPRGITIDLYHGRAQTKCFLAGVRIPVFSPRKVPAPHALIKRPKLKKPPLAVMSVEKGTQ